MSVFKNAEWIADMNSSEVINQMKNITFPLRTKGGNKTTIKTETVQRLNSNNKWFDYELMTPVCRYTEGTDMSRYRPIIDGNEYKWGELKRLPKELLQVKLYRYWLSEQIYSGEE